MSTFLNYQSYLIPLGSTVLNVHTTIRNALTTQGFQIVHDSTLMAIQSLVGNYNNTSYPVAGVYSASFPNALTTPVYPRWTGIQLVNSTQCTQVAISGSPDTPGRSPQNFTIDYSDDGITWTTAVTVTNCINWSLYERRIWNIPAVGNHMYWRVNITANNGDGSWIAICGVEFMDQFGNVALTNPNNNDTYFDCIPPTVEAIGDANGRGLLRIEFTSTSIIFKAIPQSLSGMPTVISLSSAGTAGNVQYGFTLGSSALIQQNVSTMSASNTAAQNLRYLYDAIKGSSDPVVTSYTWTYSNPAAQNANDGYEYITGRKTSITQPGTWDDILTVSGGLAGGNAGRSVPPGFNNISYPYYIQASPISLTVDLANGFIYYLQINSRGIALATKTNTNYYGPIHACYGNHDIAVAATPVTQFPAEITPIELVVGVDGGATNSLTSAAWPTHFWGLSCNQSNSAVSQGNVWPASFGQLFNRSALRQQMMDYQSCAYQSAYFGGTYYPPGITLVSSNIWNADSNAGNDYQIHRVSNPGIFTLWNDAIPAAWGITAIVGQISISDWYKFRGTATQESLLLVADTVIYNTLATTIPYGVANPTTVDLVSTAGFASAGYVSINDEIFQYTGVSGNSLTGITRASYGSTKRSSYVGDSVYQCYWFTVINGGALLCGYAYPT